MSRSQVDPSRDEPAPAGPHGCDADPRQLEELIGGVDAVLFEYDVSARRFSYVSPAAERLFGYPRERWLSEPRFWSTVLVDASDREEVVSLVRREVAAGREHEAVYRARAADGRTLWIRDVVRVHRDAGGQPSLLRGLLLDITRQREAERAARESESRFRAVIDHAEAAIYAKDPSGRFIVLNRHCAELMNVDPTSAIGVVAESLLPEEVAKEHRRNDRLVLETGEPIRVEESLQSDSGRRTFVSTKFPLRDDRGEIRAVGGVSTEITGLRRAEARLAEREERLRLAAEATGFGTYDYNVAAGTSLWSTQLQEIHGYDGDQPVSQEQLAAFVHPEDRERFREMVQRALSPSEPDHHEIELRIVRPDGQVRWIRDVGRTYFEGEGESRRAARVVGTVQDVTERRRYEEHLRTVMAELNHRVKNTIAVIQAIAQQTVRRSDDLETFSRSFQERLRSIAAAHSLLTSTDWAGVSIADVVRTEVEPRLASDEQLDLAGPGLVLEPKAALAVHMVVHELATNACKYGALRDGGGRLRVEWRPSEGGDREVELDWIEQLRSEPPPKGPEGFGSQLIAQVLEYELGGSVECVMTPSGLHVRLRFPVSRDPRDARPPADDRAGRDSRDAPSPEQAPRVLLAEDSLTLALAIMEDLEAHGCRVVGPASSLEQASALAESEQVDVALLDVNLRTEAVFPLARRLLERGTPVALLTGYNREDLPEDLRETPILTKPVSADAVSGFVLRSVRPRSEKRGRRR